MTLREFAEMANTPINTVRHWRAIGYGPKTARIGRRVMVRRADAEEWLAQQFATQA
jgi:DNA-binding transcriptional MerR regulator